MCLFKVIYSSVYLLTSCIHNRTNNIIAGIIRKDKISVSEIEDAIQSGAEKGSIGIINSLAELFVDERITLEQAKSQIEEKNIEILNRTIMQLKIKRGKTN